MNYHQITIEERYTISAYLMQGFSPSAIARVLNRHRSTISRELRRNTSLHDGSYRPDNANARASRRKWASRRRWQFTELELQMVISLIQLDWSPEQTALWLNEKNIFSISHTTIYRYIWYDAFFGGKLFKHLRQSNKKRRKAYGAPDSRGVLLDKRHITERPLSAENKSRFGHWEIDTVVSGKDKHCIVTIVDRKSKYTIIGKIKNRTKQELNKKVIQLIRESKYPFKTITADNGVEFHGYKDIEKATDVKFYFANPYHSWERGLNENTNGLIRQYIPKRSSMKNTTQADCDKIARKLNTRPRKTLKMKTPEQYYGTR